MVRNNLLALFLVIAGTLNIIGDLTNIPSIKALGLATQASPAPKVFTAHKGFETYSANFFIDWLDNEHKSHSLQITPKIYRQIQGPYNRRNAYGAALSYGPVLYSNGHTRDMLQSVMHYAFCNQAPILHEMGINPATASEIKIRIIPRQKLNENQWKLVYDINC